MFSPVASGIFAIRNVGKVENGELGRAPVVVGQFAGVMKEISKYDKTIGVGAKNALSVFKDIAGDSKALKYGGKAVEFMSNNINPLICASSVIKIANSQDKELTFREELGSLGTMFLCENLVAKNYDKLANSKTVTDTISKMSKSKTFEPIFKMIAKRNWGGKVGSIIKGLTFVTASIGGSMIGLEATKSLLKNTDRFGYAYMNA